MMKVIIFAIRKQHLYVFNRISVQFVDDFALVYLVKVFQRICRIVRVHVGNNFCSLISG